MEGPSASKKRHLTSECMTQTMTNFCYLDTNIRLSINQIFNDVKVWTNLIYINLSSNMITNLARALGDLPHLQQLNLSHNCLGSRNKIKWTWLRQTTIKNTLLILDISYNLLTELPPHIGRLNALVELNVCHNMLKCLPVTIANMRSLITLDVSYNRLLYLEDRLIFRTNLRRMNVSMNLFPAELWYAISLINVSVVPRLVDLSVKTILLQRIPYEGLIPDELVDYLDMMKRCNICTRFGKKFLCNYYLLPPMGTVLTPDKPVVIKRYYCTLCF